MKRQWNGALRSPGDLQRQTLGREASLALLDRSIAFGHGRLAVIRLSMAVHAGATVEARQWSYCESVVRSNLDSDLQSILQEAAERAGRSLVFERV